MTKSIFTTIVFALIATVTFAADLNNEPNVINNEEVTFVLADGTANDVFYEASYNEETQDMYFATASAVEMIEITDADGELVYMMPIGSDKLYVSLLDMDSGKYNVTMVLKDQTTIYANMNKK